MPVTTCLLHDILLVADQRAELRVAGIVERRAHIGLDLVHHRHFDRTHLQDLGPERGHLEHFLERHLVEPPRLRHDARIGGVDAVDVGVDVAAVGVKRRGQRHRRSVRAAAAERRHAVGLGANALEAGDDCDLALGEACDDPDAVDAGDARRAVRVVGRQRDLPALPGARVEPHAFQDDGEQAGGDEFARGDDRVVFGGIVERRGLGAPRPPARWSCPTWPRRRRRPRGPRRPRASHGGRRCGCDRHWRRWCRRISGPDAPFRLGSSGASEARRASGAGV